MERATVQDCLNAAAGSFFIFEEGIDYEEPKEFCRSTAAIGREAGKRLFCVIEGSTVRVTVRKPYSRKPRMGGNDIRSRKMNEAIAMVWRDIERNLED